VRSRRIQRKKYELDWRRRERRDLRYDYISFVDFFIFNLNGLLKGIYGIARLKNSKQTEQNNWTVQFLDAF
jgi:hypothetical protein